MAPDGTIHPFVLGSLGALRVDAKPLAAGARGDPLPPGDA
jgi:hypothetical protein